MRPVIVYRNTFLQVPLEERMGESGHRRAVSVPARLPGQADLEQEPSLSGYLSNVSQSLGSFWANGIPPALWTGMRHGADQPAEAMEEGEVHQTPDDPVPSAEPGIWSPAADEPSFAPPCLSETADPGADKDDEHLQEVLPGNLGHPEFCRRPCILFSVGKCAADVGCEYCHLPHHRKPKLPQAIRWQLEAMRAAERLEILMQILRKKEAGMPHTLPSIQKLITILNEALETANYSQASSTDRKAVQAKLAKMPVAALLGDVFTFDFDPEVRACLQQELSNLRAECATMPARSQS